MNKKEVLDNLFILLVILIYIYTNIVIFIEFYIIYHN